MPRYLSPEPFEFFRRRYGEGAVIANVNTGKFHTLVPWPAQCHVDTAGDAGHLRPFRSGDDAERAGYRACLHCFLAEHAA